ncbi:MAG: DUF3422 family protein [Planktomarina sp.]
MAPIEDHPLRMKLANELHARPFARLHAPMTACYMAIKKPQDAAARDRNLDFQHLLKLLDYYGADHPSPGATHYYGQVGKVWLKWEQHTEFTSYTAFSEGISERPFDPIAFEAFPLDWLEAMPGTRLTSAIIRVALEEDEDHMCGEIEKWFVADSLAASRVLDQSAVLATDFRIDPAGHIRLAVFVKPDTTERRIGRIVQRISEIETYKAMSMLGFARVKGMSAELEELDLKLTHLIEQMAADDVAAEETLQKLLNISAELENLSSLAAFRFSATKAYDALVGQRIEVMREERCHGRQTFREFMMRRFDPAMRTVVATETRLQAMADRAMRAGNLLRTRVDVERQGQNQKLLASMDRRADAQLQLQKTVEGLSVVAISYYAINLVLYILGPVPEMLGLSKYWAGTIVAPLVILGVWYAIGRIKDHVE